MSITLEDFLVKLGAQTDETSFLKFQSVLNTSSSAVDKYAVGIGKSFLKAQIEIVTAFTAISASVLALVNKVTSENTSFRIFGESMLLSTSAARQMKMATDALGLSIDQIYWDKISAQKFDEITKIIDAFDTSNPNFQKKMEGLEVLQFQFKKLEVGFKLLTQAFSVSIFDKLGGTDLGKKLTGWVDELLKPDKINALGDKLATFFAPILLKTWDLLIDIGEAVKAFSDDFSDLIGILTGDSSIEKSTDSFEKLSKALVHVVDLADRFVQAMTVAEIVVANLVKAFIALTQGDFSKVSASLNEIQKRITPEGGAVGGLLTGSTLGTGVGIVATPFVGPEAIPIAASAGGIISALGGYLWGKTGQGVRPSTEVNKFLGSGPTESNTLDALTDFIKKQEGYKPGSLSYKNNNPGNLIFNAFTKGLGGSSGEGGFAKFDSYEAGLAAEKKNIDWYAKHGYTYSEMFEKWAPRSDKRNDTDAYIRNAAAAGFGPNQKVASAGVTINGGIHVTVPDTNATPEDISNAVIDAMNRQVQIDLSQLVPNF